MSKRKTRPSQATLLTRDAVITGWRASLHILAERRRGSPRERKGSAWLVLEGKLTEPVDGVSDFSVHVFPVSEPYVGQAEIPSVGSFIRTKPVMDGVVELSEREFDFVVTLVALGRIASCSVAFQPPRYRRALIASIGFSSDPPTPEEDA